MKLTQQQHRPVFYMYFGSVNFDEKELFYILFFVVSLIYIS